MLKEELEVLGYDDIELLDGFDKAFIGISHDNKAVYDYELMLECLDMETEDAVEYIYENKWDNVVIFYEVKI